MDLNLLSDINLQISSNVEAYNKLEVKSYETIGLNLDNTFYLKFHLLDYYSFNNISILFSAGIYRSLEISYSVDNINWTVLQSGITGNIVSLNFDEITCAYLKLSFVDAIRLVFTSMEITVTDARVDTYNSYFQDYKKDEMKEFLTKKIFEGSDIETIFNNYMEL